MVLDPVMLSQRCLEKGQAWGKKPEIEGGGGIPAVVLPLRPLGDAFAWTLTPEKTQ